MKDVQSLIKNLETLDTLLTNCMKCGMCQGVCPVFSETQNEGDVARGKIYLLEGLASKMLSDAKGVKDRLDKCLLCGTCSANCPSGVNSVEIFLKARLILTQYIGLSAVKKIIFRTLLSRPGLFNRLISIGVTFQGLFIKRANEESGTFCASILTSLAGNRHFPALASKPFRKTIPSLNTSTKNANYKIAFFPGCVVDKVYPNIGEAALKVFNHHNVDIFLPPNQGCCGIPALSSGERDAFRKLFLHNLDLFGQSEFDYLITPCATCTTTIKEIWPMMADEIEPTKKAEAEKLANKTMDINQFLVDKLGVKSSVESKAEKTKITYHDPCHLGKSLGVFSQPRQILQSNQGMQLVEMKDANSCCGSGGSFNLQHYQLSADIGNHKALNIKATNAKIVATGCPACMLQLTDVLSQNKMKTKVQHCIEVYADSLNE